MTGDLGQGLTDAGRSLETAAAWISAQLDRTWEPTWRQKLPQIQEVYERMGEPAYGVYNRELFAPIQHELAAAGLRCAPSLPGSLPLSEEEWGAEDHRERRMWTLLHDEQGRELGAIVTRFFHDHTQLRLPEPPTAVGLPEVEHDRIRAIVLQDPSTWPTCRALPTSAPATDRRTG